MSKSKELGQNFLINQTTINNFLTFSELNSKDNILEIGIGEGALTIPISKTAQNVVSIELDTNLVIKAKSWVSSNTTIINQNFLDCDLQNLINSHSINKIIASIPYSITSPIIHKIISQATPYLKDVYLIAQKEFVQKVIKKESRGSYFTFYISNWATLKVGEKINKEDFLPIPKVDSQSFGFSFFDYPKNHEQVVKWSRFLHYTFATPRKKINKRFELEVLNKFNIDPNKRPENLTLEELNKLYNTIKEK